MCIRDRLGVFGAGRKTWDWDEYNNRIANAVAGGGLIGGSLGSFGGTANTREFQQLVADKGKQDPNKRTAEQIAHERVASELGVSNIQEGLDYADGLAAVDATDVSAPSLKGRGARHKATENDKSIFDKLYDVVQLNEENKLLGLLRSISVTGITNDNIKNSPDLAVLASFLGGRKAGILAGDPAEQSTRFKATPIKETAFNKDTALREIYGSTSHKTRAQFAIDYQAYLNNAVLTNKPENLPQVVKDNLPAFQ